jgi:hypothetical protein
MRVNLEINRLLVRQSAHRIFLAAALLATCLVAGALMPRSRARKPDSAPIQAICGCSAMSRRISRPGIRWLLYCMAASRKAVTFARDAGWLALADRGRLGLLLPEQKDLPSYL